MKTYWIVGSGSDAGWQHGLPPSITAAEWPRHARSGLPLVHGFTIRVPAEYRARGADRVALSYFHPGDTESYPPAAAEAARVQAIFGGAGLTDAEAAQPFFRALAEHASARKDRTQLFTDLLQHTHAIVWLTEDELAAPRCARPSSLPEGSLGKAMALDQPVRDAEPLGFSASEPERGTLIQLGGPLHWIQSEIEEFGDVVMEIEDGVGNANYGTGNCQIDLAQSLLDWAC
jgi:hypothetical protein